MEEKEFPEIKKNHYIIKLVCGSMSGNQAK